MAVICAVELCIADIIHSQSGPVTLLQIASSIEDSPSLDISFLEPNVSKKVALAAFKKAHGCELWDYASQNVEFNTLTSNAMAYDSMVISKAVILGLQRWVQQHRIIGWSWRKE
ncbi:hypothetical protein REPUB_Repub10bG0043800 [Reevesia pubescens]